MLVLAMLGSGAPAFAQEASEAPPVPAPSAAEAAAPQGTASNGTRTYAPADFARFAPRSALDMLNNLPGFAIDEGDTERRGLGQATGNVLINGERFNSKSVDIFTELGRISAANVARIEIVDGATLNISGLTGQVANVVTLSQGLAGNFVWRPQIRARRTPPRVLDGEISINGSLGGTQYTLSLANVSRRNGNAGPEIVTTPAGVVLDRRDEVLSVNEEQPRLAGTIRRTFGDGSILNANAAFALYSIDLGEDSFRSGPGQPDRDRRLREREREHNYELGGDYEFGLGGGRLKLIGLHRAEHSPYRQTLVTEFSDGRPTEGERFTQTADEAETILRGEYRWRGGPNDWQVSLEGAVNRLDVESGLFALNAAGEFVAVPFPNSEATVEERRGEAILTYGRQLALNLTLQLALGGEYSNLVQDGAGGLDRTFYRPKGFLNLAWRPADGWDVSARLERAVDQLDFFDFVASANVSGGTQDAGNANLVPPQSWNAQVQATRNLGPWGTATARVFGRLVSDVVDIIPIGETGQAPGNLEATARRYGVQWTSTFNFDPLGWRGAKVDMNIELERTSLRDPLTGRRRAFNEVETREIEVNFRHDVPRTAWAWGATFEQFRQSAGFRLDQRFRFLDTPGSLGVFIEHKDVMGLTVRASVDNILDTNESFSRTFFDGRRNPTESNILFTEDRDRFYGPVFTLSISGTI
ncbi:TonB-dependent receptor [Sphingosinicella sp. LHD-64]|uniref:TonB-dependent receptor plug domain-containing protein n=1 Tax=Sphingosinicella sp. LHD-64 TaxID=3072139 RepID=UPI00280C6678|nr:TonB-dependent receptor plug domain-containing protein [Sphingosinicella sp. LHD-64]MDQ8757136.1 TonB-dependent receptor [Sphingosinicella sp. LHD-64]